MPRIKPQYYEVDGLGTADIDGDGYNVTVTIRLAQNYRGDLRNFEGQNGLPPDVYLVCTDVTALNNPHLAMFLEEAYCWDSDGDGSYDAENMRLAIEEALWRTTEEPQKFERPKNGRYTRGLMKFMPPQPDRHIVYDYGRLQRMFRWYQYPVGVLMLVLFIVLINVQIHYVPWLKYSVLSAVMDGGRWIGINPYLALALFIVGLNLFRRKNRAALTNAPHTYGFFNKAAAYEEQAFREGAENWSLTQRAYSCLAFGAIHMVNLFYPLATILPLALCGAIFMRVYLRQYRQTGNIGIAGRRLAVLKAASSHRLYNRLALTAFVLSLAILAVGGIYNAVAIFATLVGAILTIALGKRHAVTQPALSPEPTPASAEV